MKGFRCQCRLVLPLNYRMFHIQCPLEDLYYRISAAFYRLRYTVLQILIPTGSDLE